MTSVGVISYRRPAHWLISLGLLWTFGVTLLRGSRQPNDWAEAHWLISYAFGPIKRGLPATLLRPLLVAAPARAETIITIVSSAITVVLCFVLLAMCWTILRRNDYSTNAVLAVAAFVTSPFVVMTGHLNGYFDAQIILLTVAATVLTLRGRSWLAALTLTAGLLIHETIFVIGLPVVVWAALLRPAGDRNREYIRRLVPFLLPLAAFIVLFAFQSFAVDAAELESALIAHLQMFPFIEYDQEVIVPRSFAKSFVAHFRSQSPRVWGRLFDPGLMVAVLPTVTVLLLFTRNALRARDTRRGFIAAALFLPFLPLTLHLIAWDTARIWTYPIIVSMLVAWVACLVTEPQRLWAINSRSLDALALLALPLNVFGRIPLMDWRVEQFSALWRAALYLPLPASVYAAFAHRRATDYTQGTIQS
jgi:hypothetical protein